MKVIRSILFVVLVLMGIFMFLYGGYDDSPGAQLLGVVMVVLGIVGVYKQLRKKL